MPLLAPFTPCLKRGSREHESGECPKNQEHRRYMAHAKNFAARCLNTDEMNNTTAEAFCCENLTRGRVLLDCEATDTVGSVEAIESIFELTGVFVDANDRPVCQLGDANRKQALAMVRVQVQLGGHVAHLHVLALEKEGVLVLLSAKSLTALCSDQVRDGSRDLRNLEFETVV